MDVLPKWTTVVSRVQRLGNAAFDRVFHIETAGFIDVSELGFEPDCGRPYMPSNCVNLISLARMMRALDIGAGDVFLDLGCGKGQVLFVAAHFRFGRVIGIDLCKDLVTVARRNLDPGKHRFRAGRMDLVVGDAAEYQVPDDVNVCYLYNSFPRPVLERVMAQVDASLVASPRRMRILYLELEDADVLATHGFREVRRIRRLRQFVRVEPQQAPQPGDPR